MAASISLQTIANSQLSSNAIWKSAIQLFQSKSCASALQLHFQFVSHFSPLHCSSESSPSSPIFDSTRDRSSVLATSWAIFIFP